jgi:membrane dipeptidase
MRQSHYLLQNFALFVEAKHCGGDPWDEVCALHEVYRAEMENNADMIAPVLRSRDIEANSQAGKMSALLTVEEGAVCHGEISKLEKLYGMGVRMLTLTWNYPNELGYPNLDRKRGMEIPDTEHGLTERGREFLHRMEELGMIADVSHLSDAGFYDVLQYSSKPFVASHSNAREVCGCVRNLTDDMIRKLAERGGCMGLNFCADFLETVPEGQPNPGTIEAVVRHAKHIVKVGGIGVLGLGSDFDGIDTNQELPGAQSMELLWERLHQSGFTQGQLDAVFYKNVLRVYEEVL